MSENVAESLIGLAVLVAAGVFLAVLVGDRSSNHAGDSYEISANFLSAEGIAQGTDVRIAGISVGSVSGMAFNSETFEAEVTLRLDDEVLLPDDSLVAISTEGLLGGNFVEILPGGSPDNVEPGGRLFQTQSALSLIELLAGFVSARE